MQEKPKTLFFFFFPESSLLRSASLHLSKAFQGFFFFPIKNVRKKKNHEYTVNCIHIISHFTLFNNYQSNVYFITQLVIKTIH